MKFFGAVLTFAVIITVTAVEFPAGIHVSNFGEMRLGECEFQFKFAEESWRSWKLNAHWQSMKREKSAGKLVFSGSLAGGTVSETILQTGKNRYEILGQAAFPTPVRWELLAAILTLPPEQIAITVDKKTVAIPSLLKELSLFKGVAKEVIVDLPGGMRYRFHGNMRLEIQDNRKWQNTIGIRFFFSPYRGNISSASLKLNLEIQPPEFCKVELDKAANRTFEDRDGSGWTGQGAANDLSMIKSGLLEYARVPFCIGADRKAIVAGRVAPKTVRLELPPHSRGSYQAINLLHASAWSPVSGKTLGFLDVEYSDGTQQSIPVRSHLDCGNWWISNSLPNAAIACRFDNNAATVGLYASSFSLDRNDPTAITFRINEPTACWMVAAVTLSNRRIQFPGNSDQPLTMKADSTWRRIPYRSRILAGSPLDFSHTGVLDAPAGKYGRVIAAPDGTLTFEHAPQERLRLLGVNLCMMASFPDHKAADELVEELAKRGYNSVRIHHHDNFMVAKDSENSWTLDPEMLDRLDYLFASLKKRGFYITTDLFTSRRPRAGDGFPLEKGTPDSAFFKATLPINRNAMESWKKFARNWMQHKNPYTGMRWADDPALFCLNLVNEDTLSQHWHRYAGLRERYHKLFQEWRKGRPAAEQNMLCFLEKLQEKVLDEQLDFVRNELKVKAMLTSLNFVNSSALTRLRSKFDLVDNHQYFAHPRFSQNAWRLPADYDQGSAIRRLAQNPRLMMPTRIFGKPFLVTEYTFCHPNIHVAENGPLIGAYSALQNWDGLWRFSWGHSLDTLNKKPMIGNFNISSDPLMQLSDRIIWALFLRGDFAPAKEKISFCVPDNPYGNSTMMPSYPPEFEQLGLQAQIGSHPEGRALPRGVRRYRQGEKVAGEPRLRLDREAGTFAVITPLSESITLPQGSLAAGLLRVSGVDTFSTIALISLDGNKLAESGKVLLIHLTDLTNEGMRFASGSKTRLVNSGRPRLLLRRGRARIEFRSAAGWRVAALRSDGKEQGVVSGKSVDGVFSFSIDNTRFPEGVMAYCLTRE